MDGESNHETTTINEGKSEYHARLAGTLVANIDTKKLPSFSCNDFYFEYRAE